MSSALSDWLRSRESEKDEKDGALDQTVPRHSASKATLPADNARQKDADKRVCLVVLCGNNVGEVFTLNQGVTVLGRDDNAHVQIMDAGTSRQHAAVFYDPQKDRFQIHDLGSRNGTRLNGEPVSEPQTLARGDKIEIGMQTVLRVSYGDEAETQYARRMYDQVLRDGLTGVFNRRYLTERLDSEVAFAKRHKTALSLIMLDIDHFKKINDTYGHPTGDQVLKQLADRVMLTIRTEDVLTRYGGEEFAILCRDIAEASAAILAERVRSLVADRPFAIEAGELEVTVSLGVADLLDIEAESQALLDAADKALYVAKDSGRNCVRLFSKI
jgi:two-component system cell cycle response regulator